MVICEAEQSLPQGNLIVWLPDYDCMNKRVLQASERLAFFLRYRG